jgi:hypothetical protein
MVRTGKSHLEEEEDYDEEFLSKAHDVSSQKGGKSNDQKLNAHCSKHSETEQRRRSKINESPSWLVDSSRIATKIRSASGSGSCESGKVDWKSNPTKACPNCQHIVDNSDVSQEWPGLPKGVKFDPSDQEIIWHLLAKSGVSKIKPHPFIDEFIPTVDEEGGICYSHPQKLPGTKQDGSVSHFFHRAIKAYNTGTRKRRKINGIELGDVRWHKTGRTKPVFLDGFQRGCKKIMVLYASLTKGGKPEKTSWVMHQYHLGTEEDENDGEYVISKIFYQQQLQVKQTGRVDEELIPAVDSGIVKVDPVTPMSAIPAPPRVEKRVSSFAPEPLDLPLLICDIASGEYEELIPAFDSPIVKEDPVTPISATPAPPQDEKRVSSFAPELLDPPLLVCDIASGEDEAVGETKNMVDEDNIKTQSQGEHMGQTNESQNGESNIYWLSSQQLKECINLCDDFQSQSPNRDGNEKNELSSKPLFSDYYAGLRAEDLKRDIQECRDLVFDAANIEIDTPDDFRLSQLDFGSQSSFP